jgi:GAF domain-containing protein
VRRNGFGTDPTHVEHAHAETLAHDSAPSPMLCRASVGNGGPPLGTRVDVNAGFSGACVRSGKALRCDDAETDSRVVSEVCRKLGVRSIAAAPIRYEREVVGLVEVFSPHSFAFDEGDLAILERLAQTAILVVSQSHLLQRD